MCYDAETPDMYSERVLVSRKDHKCSECGSEIDRSKVYCRHKWALHGEFDTWAECIPCMIMRHQLSVVKVYPCKGEVVELHKEQF